MMMKYRVHEVAKDLNLPNKEVIDLLGKHFEGQKKHMTALNEDELDVVFEDFTQKTALVSFCFCTVFSAAPFSDARRSYFSL